MKQNKLNVQTVYRDDTTACTIICGDSREECLPFENQIDLIVTSPPYADARMKHYGGVSPEDYTDWFLTFAQPFYKALKPTGSLILNIKDKVVDGIRNRYVWRTLEALCTKGFYAIEDYIWHKTNPMPGFWPNRLRDGWEYCFHLAKTKRPFFNSDAVKQPIGEWSKSRLKNLALPDQKRHNSENQSGFGRDLSRWVGKQMVSPSNVISCAVVGKNKGHPAVFPVELPSFFIKLLCPEQGLILDPFSGSGTTGIAALSLGRSCVLIEKNPEYAEYSIRRFYEEGLVV